MENPNDDVRTGLSAAAFQKAFTDNLLYVLGRFRAVATPNDQYLALAYAVRDRLLRRFMATSETYYLKRSRTVCYLSAEFLMGPQLGNNLVNLGIYDEVRRAMKDLGLDLEDLLDQEEEPSSSPARCRT